MITRRASVMTQNRPDVSRASFVHVVVPRTEQRCAEGEKRPHSVYLVRLLSHLGEYPTTDSWYELRYSRVAELHTHLRAEHPGLRLPWLPRARWLGSQHPAYVSAMREEIERYLRQLLTHWLRSYGGFDSFIMLLHAAHHGEPFPPPPDVPQNRRGSTSSGEPSFAPSTPASSRTTPPQLASPSLDTEALVVGLSWREYQEHTENLLCTTGGETNPFEEAGEPLEARPLHLWRVDNFTVSRLPAEADVRAGLTLRSSDAYLVLASIADGGRGAGGGAGGGGGGGTNGGGAKKSWHVHFWIGASCGADKAGAAAALTVQLCGLLEEDEDGDGVGQHREEQVLPSCHPSIACRSSSCGRLARALAPCCLLPSTPLLTGAGRRRTSLLLLLRRPRLCRGRQRRVLAAARRQAAAAAAAAGDAGRRLPGHGAAGATLAALLGRGRGVRPRLAAAAQGARRSARRGHGRAAAGRGWDGQRPGAGRCGGGGGSLSPRALQGHNGRRRVARRGGRRPPHWTGRGGRRGARYARDLPVAWRGGARTGRARCMYGLCVVGYPWQGEETPPRPYPAPATPLPRPSPRPCPRPAPASAPSSLASAPLPLQYPPPPSRADTVSRRRCRTCIYHAHTMQMP